MIPPRISRLWIVVATACFLLFSAWMALHLSSSGANAGEDASNAPEKDGATIRVSSDASDPHDAQSIPVESESTQPIREPGESADKMDGIEVASRETPTGQPNEWIRVRIVRTHFKYPLVRISERVVKNPDGHETVSHRESMVADHLMVKLAKGTTEKQLDLLNEKYGATIRRRMTTLGLYLVAFPGEDPDALPQIMKSYLGESASIAYAEPDYIARAQRLPNDPLFDQQWGMRHLPAHGGVLTADISAVKAWDVTQGDHRVLVGVIDSGMEMNHPDLAPNLWTHPGEIPGNGIDDDGNGYVDDVHGWDFVHQDNDPSDDRYHGTVVSGIIGARGNDEFGMAGVCWNVSLVPIKFLDETGEGTLSDAVEAIRYATRLGVDVTNNSWGGYETSQSLADAIEEQGQHGILFVAAAGNSGEDSDVHPLYPAAYPFENIISVAASDEWDNFTWFSNWGATSVDLAAPGWNVLTTSLGGSHASFPGTSVAAPFVTGVCALLKSKYPGLDASEIKQAILDGVDHPPDFQGRVVSNGRLNALGALNAAKQNFRIRGAVAAGRDESFVVRQDGTVWHWGGVTSIFGRNITPVPFDSDTAMMEIQADRNMFFSLGVDGTLWTRGHAVQSFPNWHRPYRTADLLPVTQFGTQVEAVSVGPRDVLVVLKDGTLWTTRTKTEMDDRERKSFPSTSKVTGLPLPVLDAVSGRETHLALLNDGSVWVWQGNRDEDSHREKKKKDNKPVQVTGLPTIIQIAAGDAHWMALDQEGSVWTWGKNEFGQLGFVTQNKVIVTHPRKISRLPKITSIAAGNQYSLFIDTEGRLWSCGANHFGQLGLGHTQSISVPVCVKGLPPLAEVTGGATHTLAVDMSGDIWGWGSNVTGQLGVNNWKLRRSLVPIQVKGIHLFVTE